MGRPGVTPVVGLAPLRLRASLNETRRAEARLDPNICGSWDYQVPVPPPEPWQPPEPAGLQLRVITPVFPFVIMKVW